MRTTANASTHKNTDSEGVQAPCASQPDQTKNAGKVVGKNSRAEPRAVHKTGGAKDLLVLLPESQILLSERALWVLLPITAFVNLKELLCDVLKGSVRSRSAAPCINWTCVVVAVEQDKKGANSRRQQEKAILCERVRLQDATAVVNANLVKRVRVMPVQRRQVNVGRGFVHVGFLVRSAEDAGQDFSELLACARGHKRTCG
jgi:hypothetical protein